MPKHLEINNYTPTAPRTRQPSASLPITPLASIFHDVIKHISKSVLRKVVSVPPCHFHAPLTPRRKRRSHIADHVFSDDEFIKLNYS